MMLSSESGLPPSSKAVLVGIESPPPRLLSSESSDPPQP
ncbi:hypothetical protein OROHE_017554 [Orobanche hederae]